MTAATPAATPALVTKIGLTARANGDQGDVRRGWGWE